MIDESNRSVIKVFPTPVSVPVMNRFNDSFKVFYKSKIQFADGWHQRSLLPESLQILDLFLLSGF